MAAIHVAGVRPQRLAHDARIRSLTLPVDLSDLVESDSILREETSVRDHDLLVDNVTDWQEAE